MAPPSMKRQHVRSVATYWKFVGCSLFIIIALSATTNAQQQLGSGTCGNGSVGNGICADPTLCCNSQGNCGSTTAYCNYGATISASPASSPVASASGNTAIPTTTSIASFFTPAPSTPAPVMPSTPYPTAVYSNCPNLPHVMSVNLAYYQSSAAYRSTSCNRVLPGEIDVLGGGYTHLAYAFAGIDSSDNLVPWNSDYANEVPMYGQFNGLKAKYPNIKTLITIGGWTFNNPGKTRRYFSSICSSPSRIAHFAQSIVAFLQKYGFDGVDLDWEFPGFANRGGSPSDYQNLPLLLQGIRSAYSAAGRSDYMIAIATPPNIGYMQAGYNLTAMAPYLDFFSVLAYEVNGLWTKPPVVLSNSDLSYVGKAVDFILSSGVPSNKVVLGLASFGISYTLSDPTCNTAGCPFSGVGFSGCGGSYGDIPRFNIDPFITSGEYNALRFDNASATMEIVTNNTNWITYDDYNTWSIRSAYALKKCLRGYFWWTVDMLSSPVPLSPRAGAKPVPPTPSPTTHQQLLLKASGATGSDRYHYQMVVVAGLVICSVLILPVGDLLF